MESLRSEITIKAPRKAVWHAMLDDAPYRRWTRVFAEGSRYEGDWNEGSKLVFMSDHDGGGSGMVSRVAENRPYEFISLRHVGIVKDGVEDTTSEAAAEWTPAFENYTFEDVEGGTRVVVEMEMPEKHIGMFAELWPRALEALKEVAEEAA
jgi:uncharacterized protein YndB with AHSA1/START domain